MPILSQEKLIKEFWENQKGKYPNIDYKHFEDICSNPFKFVKYCIREGKLVTISIQYFGKFKVFTTKLRQSIKDMDYQLRNNYMTQEEYNSIKEFKTNHLRKIQDAYKKKSKKPLE